MFPTKRYFKRGWEEGLTTLDHWWYEANQYANLDGDYSLADDFHEWSNLLYRFVQDKAKMDTTTIWEVGQLIERREGKRGKRSWLTLPDPDATIRDIRNALYRSLPTVRKLWQLGMTDKKPGRGGRRKAQLTRDVERLLDEGVSVDEINARTGASVENIRQIRSRQRRET